MSALGRHHLRDLLLLRGLEVLKLDAFYISFVLEFFYSRWMNCTIEESYTFNSDGAGPSFWHYRIYREEEDHFMFWSVLVWYTIKLASRVMQKLILYLSVSIKTQDSNERVQKEKMYSSSLSLKNVLIGKLEQSTSES